MKKGIIKRPKRNNKSKELVSQADINQQIKEAKAKAKALLAKANTDIRAVRKDVAALKKAGIVSKRIDVRSYQPSRYMLNKIKRNADIIKGEAIAVKAAPDIRKKYRDAGTFETRGAAIIVPKDRANQTAKIKRGLVETKTRLKNGEERRVILPFKGKDLKDIAERLADDPTLDGLKDPLELFGARLFGHNVAAGRGYPDADGLGNYILENYNHLFSGKNAKPAVKNFELVRFITDDGILEQGDGVIDDEWRYRKKRDNEFTNRRRRERDALRKAALRKKETEQQRAKRLAEQKERSARNRLNKKG